MPIWLQATLPLVIGLLTAGGAFLGIRHSTRGNDRATDQRELAARREEWWRRFVWAAQLTLDESEVKRVAGLKLLVTLGQSELAKRDECQLLDVFQGRVLDALLDDLSKSANEGGSAA